MIQGKNILLLSPEPYGEVHLSKHHYAHELAKANQVWFFNARGGKSSPFPLIKIKQISKSLSVLEYYNIFRGFGKLYFWDYLLTWFISFRIRKITGKLDLAWSFEQAKFFNLKWFKADRAIFHPVDYIPSFLSYKLKIAQSADFIFSVSPEILNTIEVEKPKHFINHGVHVKKEQLSTVEESVSKKPYRIGYIGNINIPFIDIAALENCILQNPDVEFNFVGPYGDSNLGSAKTDHFGRLSKMKNCVFHGVINREKLIDFVSKFDLFLLCYDQKKYPIRVSNSHKLLEYLCTGKMVISNYLPLYEGKEENRFIMLKELNQLGNTVSKTLAEIEFWNNDENRKSRIDFAVSNSYEKQLERIEKIIYPN